MFTFSFTSRSEDGRSQSDDGPDSPIRQHRPDEPAGNHRWRNYFVIYGFTINDVTQLINDLFIPVIRYLCCSLDHLKSIYFAWVHLKCTHVPLNPLKMHVKELLESKYWIKRPLWTHWPCSQKGFKWNIFSICLSDQRSHRGSGRIRRRHGWSGWEDLAGGASWSGGFKPDDDETEKRKSFSQIFPCGFQPR